MNVLNGKSFLLALMVVSSLQFTNCKSKKTETNSTNTGADTMTTTMAPEPAPVVISADDSLKTGLVDATKDFPGVTTTVDDGEVTLTGNITRDKLPKLMQSVNSLHPKKVNNKLTITK